MQRLHYWFLGVAILASPLTGYAEEVVVNTNGDARLINEPSGARNDNNGGNTISGALIGINPGGVDNFIVHDFSNLGSVAELDGVTVSGATVTVEIAEAFDAGTEGSEADIVFLSEIAIGNVGFITGNGVITGGDNPATNGTVSFNNRAELNDPTISTPWVDAAGMDVADLAGALTELGSLPGINLPSGTPNAGLDAGGEAYIFEIDAVTAQRWVDDGLAGIALSAVDDGDGNSRFNLQTIVPTGEANTNIAFQVCPDVILGDVNGDGMVDLLDVGPFVTEIANNGTNPAADIDGNGVVNLLDVGPFIDILTGG